MNKKASFWGTIMGLIIALIALAILIAAIYTPFIKPTIEAADKLVVGEDISNNIIQARTTSQAGGSGTSGTGISSSGVSSVAVAPPTGGSGGGSGGSSGGSTSGGSGTGAGGSGTGGSSSCAGACAKYVLDTTSDSGTFTIYDTDGKTVLASVPALSGQDGYRTMANAWTRSKGAIPPSKDIKGEYTLSTSHISVSQSKIPGDPNGQTWYGAMGPYNYRINNGGTITSKIGGNTRDGFLLHQDFDPTINRGTHGCIGVEKGSGYWTKVEAALLKLKQAGKSSIPLEVVYN